MSSLHRRRFLPPAKRAIGGTQDELGDDSLLVSGQSSVSLSPSLWASGRLINRGSTGLSSFSRKMSSMTLTGSGTTNRDIENATPPSAEFPPHDLDMTHSCETVTVTSPSIRTLIVNGKNGELTPKYNHRRGIGIVNPSKSKCGEKRSKLNLKTSDSKSLCHFSDKKILVSQNNEAQKDVFHFRPSPPREQSQLTEENEITKFKRSVLNAIKRAHEEFCELNGRRQQLREKLFAVKRQQRRQQRTMMTIFETSEVIHGGLNVKTISRTIKIDSIEKNLGPTEINADIALTLVSG